MIEGIYFVFFPLSIKKTQLTLHTFANHTGRPTDQNLQKSAISPAH